MIARRLNPAGCEAFRGHLASLRAGDVRAAPRELLEDPRYSAETPFAVEVEPRRFVSRYHVGVYLANVLAALPHEQADTDAGLWSWLSVYWFDSLCPPRADGVRRPGGDQRHIADFRHRSRYSHLLYGPYLVYRRHGAVSRVLLSSPAHRDSHFYQAITGVQDLIANRGVLEAAWLLYFDDGAQKLRRGCQPSQPRRGTVRRFVRVLQQLDLTHDVYGMSGEEIVALLPAEFDAWRDPAAAEGRQRRTAAGGR